SRIRHPGQQSSSLPIQTCARLYACPAAFTAAFGFFLLRASIWFDLSSSHWSSSDFLKRQRLPSLKAGIFCFPTYLYSVSGLTPRYCEAWRMFITSRESAIVSIPFHSVCPGSAASRAVHRADMGENSPNRWFKTAFE